jgi:hypothetical protein
MPSACPQFFRWPLEELLSLNLQREAAQTEAAAEEEADDEEGEDLEDEG